MDMFECNMLSGEFPADYDTMVRTSPTYDEDLEYLQNSAVSFSQLLRADNLGPQRQRGQREEMDSPELDEDWLRDLLSSEDSFDPDFLENIDMDSLEHRSVLYEGGRDLVEEVGVSVSTSQFSEDQGGSLIILESSSLVQLLTDGPGVGISRELGLDTQLQEVKSQTSSAEVDGDGDWLGNLLTSEDSFDPDFLENLDMDSLEHRSVLEEEVRQLVESDPVDADLGYTVENEMMEEPEHNLPPTPPPSPEERSAAAAHLQTDLRPPSVVGGNQFQPRLGLTSTCHTAEVVEVILDGVSGIVKDQGKKKKCRMLDEEREVHNRLERERRRELNGAYASLREKIPATASGKKPSKQIILDAALDYCRGLAGKLDRLERIQEEEVERRRELVEQLERLQSQK